MPYITIGPGVDNRPSKKRRNLALPSNGTSPNKEETRTSEADNKKRESGREENTAGSKKRRLEDDDHQGTPAKRARLERETSADGIKKIPRFNKRTPAPPNSRTGLHGEITTIGPTAQDTHAGPQGEKSQTKGKTSKESPTPEGRRGRKIPGTPPASKVSKPRVPRCKQREPECRRSSAVHRTSDRTSAPSANSSDRKNNVLDREKWELREDQYLISAAWKDEDWSSIATNIKTGPTIPSEEACRERVRQLLGELRGQSEPARDVPEEDLLWALRQGTRSGEEIADEEFMKLVIRKSHQSIMDPTYQGMSKEPNTSTEVGPQLLKLAAAVFTNRLRSRRRG